MSTQIENYIPCFQKHYIVGARLFFDFELTADPKDIQAALGICSAAKEMLQVVGEVRTLARIFSVLDTNGRSAVAHILEARLKEIVELARSIPGIFNDVSEATTTECQQLQADISGFIDVIPKAHLLALRASSAGQLES